MLRPVCIVGWREDDAVGNRPVQDLAEDRIAFHASRRGKGRRREAEEGKNTLERKSEECLANDQTIRSGARRSD